VTPRDRPDDWSEQQKSIYTKVFKFMVTNRDGCVHPSSTEIPHEHWNTICHNAAYLAAEFLDCETLTILDSDTNEVVASSPRVLNS
jgi:hypothetical protein